MKRRSQNFFKAPNIGNKEAKAWFDQNKHRLGGRKLEDIRNEIIVMLKGEAQQKARAALLVQLKQAGKFRYLMEQPEAPVVAIRSQGFPSKGQKGAPIKIVEFADYQCPHCQVAAENLKSVIKQFPKKVEFTFIDFPINRSGISTKVAEGGVCASEQGKFWEYHYLAFDKQAELEKPLPWSSQKNSNLTPRNLKRASRRVCPEKESRKLKKRENESELLAHLQFLSTAKNS